MALQRMNQNVLTGHFIMYYVPVTSDIHRFVQRMSQIRLFWIMKKYIFLIKQKGLFWIFGKNIPVTLKSLLMEKKLGKHIFLHPKRKKKNS